MKRSTLVIIVIVVLIVGGAVWMKMHGGAAAPAAADKPASDEPAGPTTERDANGTVIVHIDDETQGNIGLKVAAPTAVQLNPELKGYGRVLDPTPLAALITEVASAQAAYMASSNELARLKTLAAQGNASARTVQAAESTAMRDQLTAQTAKDRLALSWGNVLAARDDLPNFVQSLTSQESALIRIDLPAGENLSGPPGGARIVTVAGKSAEAEFLEAAPNVDPQTQGRGFVFLMKPNALRLLTGEAVTGYLKAPGELLSGVIIPRNAVIRTEGASWVYILGGGGETYTRTKIDLDHATDNGWFVTNGVTAKDYVLVNGAQTLLSEETNPHSAHAPD